MMLTAPRADRHCVGPQASWPPHGLSSPAHGHHQALSLCTPVAGPLPGGQPPSRGCPALVLCSSASLGLGSHFPETKLRTGALSSPPRQLYPASVTLKNGTALAQRGSAQTLRPPPERRNQTCGDSSPHRSPTARNSQTPTNLALEGTLPLASQGRGSQNDPRCWQERGHRASAPQRPSTGHGAGL